ncbi:hypothetical protein [Sulfurimonas microaerophilic]|uniref:hypothetical protein n=1 Tax=Sulfurimonas microaerophilic TaxID=3058392 RepID=UPI0027147F0C|nr:hypothetical protein [Sulfurimonas sp. hsl 1-7]
MSELKKIGNWLEPQSNKIVYQWLSQPLIKELFLRYKISLNSFAEKFAKPIVRYNIRILIGKREVGTCPIMDKFVELMIKKNIKSTDIFLICSYLRDAVFNKLNQFSNDLSEYNMFQQKIGEIFDRNIANVLKNYDIRYTLSLEHNSEDGDCEEYYIERVQQIIDTQTNIIFKFREENIYLANQTFFAATGMSGLDGFQQRFSHPFSFINQVDADEELFRSQQYIDWLNNILLDNRGNCKVSIFDHTLAKEIMMKMYIIKMYSDGRYLVSLERIEERVDNPLQPEVEELADTLRWQRVDELVHTLRQQRVAHVLENSVGESLEKEECLSEEELLTEEATTILEVMKSHQKEDIKLSLTNYHFELAIKSDAEILHINRDSLVVKIRKLALYSMKVNDKVYLKMNEGNNIQAVVKDIQTNGDRLLIHDFQYVDESPLDRRKIRVKLERPLLVSVKTSKGRFKAYIKSLSSETCVLVSENLHDLEEGKFVLIWASFNQKENKYAGTVKKISAIKSGFKVIVNFDDEKNIEEDLNHYISQQQLNIIKKLQKKVRDDN